MEKNRPVYEQRLGSIRVALWENVTADGKTWWNAAISRRYKDNGEWKEAPTFNGLGDLALVAAAVAMAQDWLRRRQEHLPIEPGAEE